MGWGCSDGGGRHGGEAADGGADERVPSPEQQGQCELGVQVRPSLLPHLTPLDSADDLLWSGRQWNYAVWSVRGSGTLKLSQEGTKDRCLVAMANRGLKPKR